MLTKSELCNQFSRAIFQARTQKRVTQQTAAEAVDISVRWYQEIERGIRLPSALVMARLIRYFDLPTDALTEKGS